MRPLTLHRNLSTQPPSRSRNLLLTFDAFDTLFYPHPSVPEQYAAVAHEFGLSRTAVTPASVLSSFKETFRAQCKQYPNYGRADVLRGAYNGPQQWWGEVIRGTFTRIIKEQNAEPSDIALPAGLEDALLRRFEGAQGYTLYDDVAPFLARMRTLRHARSQPGPFNRVILGVISNSDDRVPAVLKALGVRVGGMRADQDRESLALPGFEYRNGSSCSGDEERFFDPDPDLDLVITSYEAGEEKPSKVIFDVARRQAGLLNGAHSRDSVSTDPESEDHWVCVHVGDDYWKDYCGARDAGWDSYLLPRREGQGHPDAKTVRSLVDLIGELNIEV
jgi:FMN phosphatase YigB (HAD superfamily)